MIVPFRFADDRAGHRTPRAGQKISSPIAQALRELQEARAHAVPLGAAINLAPLFCDLSQSSGSQSLSSGQVVEQRDELIRGRAAARPMTVRVIDRQGWI
jgi:hypothetical protein